MSPNKTAPNKQKYETANLSAVPRGRPRRRPGSIAGLLAAIALAGTLQEAAAQEFTPADIAGGPVIRVTVTDTITKETMSYPPLGTPPAPGGSLLIQDPAPGGADLFANYDFDFTVTLAGGSAGSTASVGSAAAVGISSGASAAATVVQTGVASRLHIAVEAGGGFITADDTLGTMLLAGTIFGGAKVEYYAAVGYTSTSSPGISYRSFPQYFIEQGTPPAATTPLLEQATEQPADPGAVSMYTQLVVSTGTVGEGVLLPGSAVSAIGGSNSRPGMSGRCRRQIPTALNRMPLEFVTRPNKRVMTPGGPLEEEAGSVLFTVPPDAPGSLLPKSETDFGDEQIDALAFHNDLFFDLLVRNVFPLEVSFVGDPANGAGDRIATYMEQPQGTRQAHFRHVDLYYEQAGPPLPLGDVDGLEYRGPLNGHDANVTSLVDDASRGTSVYSGSSAYLSHAQIVHAVRELGYRGEDEEVDVDALLVKDLLGNDEWEGGDEILFSIRAAGNWDGGEIVRLRNIGGTLELPSFLIHGGHRWDTAFELRLAFPFLTSEDVDGIEVLPVELPDLPRVTVTSTTIGDEGELIIDFESTPGVEGWQLWGGESPSALRADLVHLGLASVMETAIPGQYQASVFADAEKYFVQIESPAPLVAGEVVGPVYTVAGSTTRHHVTIEGGRPPFTIEVPARFHDEGVDNTTIYSDGTPAEFEVLWDDGVSNVSGYLGVIVTDARGERLEVPMPFEVWAGRDRDGDNLPDGWEELNGLSPFDGEGESGANGDPDGDGISNEEEFRNATDPITPQLPGRAITLPRGGVELGETAVADVYTIDTPGESRSLIGFRDNSERVIYVSERNEAVRSEVQRLLQAEEIDGLWYSGGEYYQVVSLATLDAGTAIEESDWFALEGTTCAPIRSGDCLNFYLGAVFVYSWKAVRDTEMCVTGNDYCAETWQTNTASVYPRENCAGAPAQREATWAFCVSQ